MTTKTLKKIAKTKRCVILGVSTVIHYTSEIKQQAKNFKTNLYSLQSHFIEFKK